MEDARVYVWGMLLFFSLAYFNLLLQKLQSYSYVIRFFIPSNSFTYVFLLFLKSQLINSMYKLHNTYILLHYFSRTTFSISPLFHTNYLISPKLHQYTFMTVNKRVKHHSSFPFLTKLNLPIKPCKINAPKC
jgi:hypothetical protein